jgi:hypothetical protein
MKLIRNAFAIGIAVTAVSLAACSSQKSSTGGSGGGSGVPVGTLSTGHGDTGSVGMHLTIGNGVHVNALSWTISNGTNTYTGTVQITDDAGNEAQSVEFVAGGIQAGGGYTITLSGSDSQGDPCKGSSATVTVVAGATSAATVLVTCTVPADAALSTPVDSGNIAVDAGVVLLNQAPFVCPGITGVSVSPAEVLPPETAGLTGTSTGSSGGTQTLLWTTDCAGASISNPTSPNATFACGSTPGGTACHVTLTVGLNGTGADGGSVGQVCGGVANTTTTETIFCEAGGGVACFAPTPNACATGDGGTTCVNFQTDVNNCGGCGVKCAPDGSTPNCSGGVCVAAPVTCSTFLAANAGTLLPVSTTCSPTEQVLFNKDTTGSCMACAFTSGCLDDTNGDSGQECGDPFTTFGTSAECINTLNCDIGVSPVASPAPASGLVVNAYCGAGNSTSNCETGTGPAGACDTIIPAGFSTGFTATQIVNNISVRAFASGMADAIVSCIISSTNTNCKKCLQ